MNMDYTDKISCNILAAMLMEHGVKEAVISPGSRNAPMIVALARSGAIRTTVVIDERSAAFIALGKSAISDSPVALLCTSGTAVLNYAPAVAEAYYRQIPLIVISADRPMEWIDQDDSQTLRQYEALAHYVKRSYNIPADCREDNMQWYVNRVVNDALLCAVSGRKAPVHINIQLDEPLDRMACRPEGKWMSRTITQLSSASRISEDDKEMLAHKLAFASRVLVIAGFHDPDRGLSESLASLVGRGNVAVMTERISNLTAPEGMFVDTIDSTLSCMSDEEKVAMRPDIVITLGGAIVSRFIKQYLRGASVGEHWHIGNTEATIDCLRSLTMNINMPADCFFNEIVETINDKPVTDSDYASRWRHFARRGIELHDRYVSIQPWCDLTAMQRVFASIPEGWNVQLSNGTAVRYAQLFRPPHDNRFDCNRGVSGIDGSLSTAIGAASVYDGVTLLVTGDMSAQYDIGALATQCITPQFKMIVLCNGGGGIFRFVKSTSRLPELEEYFVVNRDFPLKKLADAYGFRYFEANDNESFDNSFADFAAEDKLPCIFALMTPGELSGDVLSQYFKVKP